MSQRTTCWTLGAITLVALSMMVYTAVRVEALKISYAIQADEIRLKEGEETLRQLRYEVSSKKSLNQLGERRDRTGLPLGRPLQVKHLPALPAAQPMPVPVHSAAVPKTFSNLLSLVPEALAAISKED